MADLIDRQAAIETAIEAADKWDGGYSPEREGIIRKFFDKVPAVQPDHVADISKKVEEDCISRQAAINAIKAARIEDDGTYNWRTQRNLDLKFAEEILETVPFAQPDSKELSSTHKVLDTISRQAAIDCVTYDVEHTIECLKALPSAQPERKMGKWIYNSPVTMKCNQCGFVIKDWDWHRFKFCPNCDCDMRGEQK